MLNFLSPSAHANKNQNKYAHKTASPNLKRSFLPFFLFYLHFLQKYSNICQLFMTLLLCKEKKKKKKKSLLRVQSQTGISDTDEWLVRVGSRAAPTLLGPECNEHHESPPPFSSAVRRLPKLFIRTTQRVKTNIAAG